MDTEPTTIATEPVVATPHKKLSGGAVAAIVIIVIIILVAIGFVIYWFVFRKKSTSNSWSSPKTLNASQDAGLTSPNSSYYLNFQPDGNLVFYSRGITGASHTALWATGTNGNSSAYLDFTSNGNLYIYSDPTKATIIYSNTLVNGNSGPYKLNVGNSGVFYETNSAGNTVLQFYPTVP